LRQRKDAGESSGFNNDRGSEFSDGLVSTLDKMKEEVKVEGEMTMNPKISTNITVKQLIERYPQLLKTFMDMGLMCVGCPTEAFHTMADVAREYHISLDQLLERISKTIGDSDVIDDD